VIGSVRATRRTMRLLRLGRRHDGRTCVIALVVAIAACSPDQIVGSGSLPPGVVDPGITKTPAGALAAYRGTLALFAQAFGGSFGGSNGISHIVVAGILSDELQANSVGDLNTADPLDSRVLPELSNPALEQFQTYLGDYRGLQQVRGQAEEARGLLEAYGGDSGKVLVGHLYAIEAYSELFLADLFCSGIPLSTVDYNGDYTYAQGSTTSEVYQHAATFFDSTIFRSTDSARILNLALIGKARALLALGRYGEAGQAVAAVPDGFQYTESFAAATVASSAANFALVTPPGGEGPWIASVSDREGIDGLDYRSSRDPRTSATPLGPNIFGTTLYHPDKYATDGSSSIVLADWVEARLIEAEVALQAGDVPTWLAKLNHLRETAITPALPDTTDPGTPDGRVNLLFRERAFWLFLTGHRQGDLRRLIRQYGRDQSQVYPSGLYPGGTGTYGSDITAPIPALERQYNPRFAGCASRGA